MGDKLELLLDYVQSEGRVCPMPTFWKELWEILPNRKQNENGSWSSPLPLILAAWWDATADQKRERLIHHINYAASNNALNDVDNFLRKLNAEQWAYGDGTTDWEKWHRNSK